MAVRNHRKSLALSLLLCAVTTAYGQSSGVAGQSFYADKERGWFWYEEPPPTVEEEEPLPPEEPQVVVVPEEAKPQEVLAPAPAPGSIAWIKENLPRMRDRAIENPTDENIAAYYYAQRLMLDMSERFARRANEVIAADPLLDEDLRSPASNAVAESISRESVKVRNVLMKRIADKAAIMFFFNGADCRMCGPTITALTSLQNQYGFIVMPVSMDGHDLPGNPFQAVQYDAGLAKHLGVIASPALALAVPPFGAEIVSHSAVSMDVATQRILAAAHRQNLITEQERMATERINSVGLIDNRSLSDAPDDITENPTEFINRMREEARKAFYLHGAHQ